MVTHRFTQPPDLIDWAPLVALEADWHAAPFGRPSCPPLLMHEIQLLQPGYRVSDPVMAEKLRERLSFGAL